ncbi:hypothetical protein MYAM1_003829 [Malassezia yamatoensis]|uniref:DNA damage-binding protein CMR1 n=1 Tax=Malassezia yamatoensis TaxID=253288 RepID=A0AAJ6CI64_9BASI|nr:hypothetical protein MYAM1_003829 [Malassezia yamatoensis]
MVTTRSKSRIPRSHNATRPVSCSSHRRQRMDSDEEQSSWIADDICTHCGGLAPHGKLYCSRECRDADGIDAQHRPVKSSHTSPPPLDPPHLSSLRYNMTLSPPVPNASSLKPAKSRSLQMALAMNRPESSCCSSSEDEFEKDFPRSYHSRHGSNSSTSTSSDMNDSALTTPSPWQPVTDLDDRPGSASNALEDDLQLPPAVLPTHDILLRKGVSHASGRPSSNSFGSVLAPCPVRTSPGALPVTFGVKHGSQMQFIRMPSTTNLPTPVVYAAGHGSNRTRHGSSSASRSSLDSSKDTSKSCHSSFNTSTLPTQTSKWYTSASPERAMSSTSLDDSKKTHARPGCMCLWKQHHSKTLCTDTGISLENGMKENSPCTCTAYSPLNSSSFTREKEADAGHVRMLAQNATDHQEFMHRGRSRRALLLAKHSALTVSEQQRLANIAENERLLKELGIAGGGSSVLGALPQKRGSSDAARKSRKRVQAPAKPTRVQPQRSSARLQGAKPEETGAESFATQAAAEREREQVQRQARHEQLDLKQLTGDFLDEESMERLRSTLDVEVANIKQEEDMQPPTELASMLQSLQLKSQNHVAQKRIASMVYHPSLEKDLIFTGDMSGVVGVWDASATNSSEQNDEQDKDNEYDLPEGSSFTLQVHARSPVGCLRIDPQNSDQIYSSSYDASIRVFSLSSCISTEVWAGSSDIQFSELDIFAPITQANVATPTPEPQLDEKSLWVADNRGGLTHLDIRTKQPVARRWRVSDKKIGAMSLNAAAPHCIATASNDRTMRLFDVRMLKIIPESDQTSNRPTSEEIDNMHALYQQAELGSIEKKMACTSIDFSPNGHHLAGVCYDDTLNVWDLEPDFLSRQPKPHAKQTKAKRTSASRQHPTQEGNTQNTDDTTESQVDNLLDSPTTIRHNNQTGKWVTLFRACWHRNAQLEPHFSIGSMTRHVEIFGASGKLLASLYDPDRITAIPAVIAMHPISAGRIATGNGSGRCALWAPPSVTH